MEEKGVFFKLFKEDIESVLIDRFNYSEEDAKKEADRAFDYFKRKFHIYDWEDCVSDTLEVYFLDNEPVAV